MRYFKFLLPLAIALSFLCSPALEARSSFSFGLSLNLISQLLTPPPPPPPVTYYVPAQPVYFAPPPAYYIAPAPVYVAPHPYFYY